MSSNDSELNNPVPHMSDVQSVSSGSMRPGAQLALLRQENGWTVEQVARHLNLAPRQVEAIEADNYSALPGAIVRGFVRGYAKLLKIDATPLLALIPDDSQTSKEMPVSKKVLATPFSETRFPSMTDRPKTSGKRFAMMLLVILILVSIWLVERNGNLTALSKIISEKISKAPEASENSPTNTPTNTLIQKPSEPESLPAATPAPQLNASPDISTSAGPSVDTGSSSTQSGTEPVSSVNTEAPAANATSATAATDTLVLTIKNDSWIEVRRSNGGSPLVSGIVKAGDTKTIEITEPLNVVIGNASAVDVSLRGSPIEIKAKAKNNVARLNVK